MTVENYPALLGFDRAVLLARQVVDEMGADYVYEPTADGCLYVENGEPACIAAHVLHRHGVPVAVLRQWEHLSAVSMAVPTFREPLVADSRTATFLGWLQSKQDSGKPWGDALTFATSRAGVR